MPSSRRPAPGPTTPGPATPGDPLAGVERVYIDGSNLLHALARGRRTSELAGGTGTSEGAPGMRTSEPAPAGAIIGRLRAVFPASVVVDLVFDGPPSGGVTGRLATGLRVSYSGRISADRVIDEGVAAQLAADGPAGTWGILVVTDDRALGDAVRSKGARTAGTAWITGRIGRSTTEAPRSPAASGLRHGSGSRSRSRPATPGVPLPKAGTTFGHRRAPRRQPSGED